MTSIVIVGGSVAGLATALAVAGPGRPVLILERGGPPPEGPVGIAAQRWERSQVTSWRHAHTLISVGVSVLRARAPQVIAAAETAGGTMLDLIQAMPPDPPGRREGDDELRALACRRPTFELVLYRIVRALPQVRIWHRVRIRGLTLDAGRNRVTGVVTDDGGHIPARVVIDATGKRAEGRGWLAAAGITLAEDRTSSCGLRVFTRFYQCDGQPGALNRGNAAGVLADHYAGVVHPGDSGTFSVSLGVLPEDRLMRTLSRPAGFTAVAQATPGVADWLARPASIPITKVHSLTCPANAMRALATEWPQPVAGLFPVGDAACVTNPLYGRGVSLAITHAFALGDLLASGPDAGLTQSHEAVRIARELLAPWYRQATDDDAERVAMWQAALTGAPPPPPPDLLTVRTVSRAAARDSVIWRGLIRVLMGLAQPAQVFGDAGFEHRVRRALAAQAAPRPAPGPTRTQLLTALCAAGA
jgi:2-polyprenyl-6-methoxyphenol hydroxylase-like FAD-dependent oxidoreductase